MAIVKVVVCVYDRSQTCVTVGIMSRVRKRQSLKSLTLTLIGHQGPKWDLGVLRMGQQSR